MASSPLSVEVVRFGQYEANMRSRELRRDGVTLRLPDQSFEVLSMLLERPGELVTRDQIHKRLWSAETFVDFDNGLNNAVKRLRDALGDSAEAPRFVETLPRRGYRFIGKIAGTEDRADTLTPGNPHEALPQPKPSKHSRITYYAAAISAILLILSAIVFVISIHSRHSAIRSIAVLPLQNLSGDPGQEYFADGTTEELTTTLAKLTDLKVISRTSAMRLKGVQKSAKEIGRDLDVDALVEGSVSRSAEKVRVTVQLIDVDSDTHLWAGEYEDSPDQILHLQQKVAREIAAQVSSKTGTQKEVHAAVASPISSNAHDLYLRARFYAAQGNPEGLTKSVELYHQAISLGPDYAAAYSGLAESYCALASGWDDTPDVSYQRGREAALKALSLDDSIPGARIVLAWVKHAYEWDTDGAEAEFQTALKMNGYDAHTHSMYASFLGDIGRFDEGLAEARLAEDLDPLSVASSIAGERVLMRGRRFDEFLKQAERSRKLDPNSVLTSVHLAIVYEDLGRFEDAIHEVETHSGSTDGADVRQVRTGLKAQGARGYWRARLQVQSKNNADDHRNMAHLHFMLGDNEAGLRELELAVQQRDPGIRFDIKSSPWWDPIRNDTRFQVLLRKVGY
jgi:TolB-like protein/DNA-binding winged helix-turn-helix (wHTH) protein